MVKSELVRALNEKLSELQIKDVELALRICNKINLSFAKLLL